MMTQENIVYYIQPEMIRTQELPLAFVGISERQASNYVAEMYQMSEFKGDVIKPTQRTTLVDPKAFRRFLELKDDAKFK